MKRGVFSLLLLLFLPSPLLSLESIDRVVAVVEGKPITQKDVEGEEKWLKILAREEDPLSSLIDKKILLGEAKRRKIEVREEEVKNFLSSLGKIQDLSEENLRKKIEEEIKIEKLLLLKKREIEKETKVEEKEVEEFLNKLKEEGKEKEEFLKLFPSRENMIRIIEIEAKNLSEAREVVDKLFKGENFEKVKDLGWVKIEDLKPSLKEIASKLEKGKISPFLVKEEGRWIVLWEKGEGISRKKVWLFLQFKKQKEAWKKWEEGLRKNTEVIILRKEPHG